MFDRIRQFIACMFSSADADDFVYRFPAPRNKD